MEDSKVLVFLQPQPVLWQEDDNTASGDSNRQEEKLKLRAILHAQKNWTEKQFCNTTKSEQRRTLIMFREEMLSPQREADALQLAQNKGPVKVRERDTIVY